MVRECGSESARYGWVASARAQKQRSGGLLHSVPWLCTRSARAHSQPANQKTMQGCYRGGAVSSDRGTLLQTRVALAARAARAASDLVRATRRSSPGDNNNHAAQFEKKEWTAYFYTTHTQLDTLSAQHTTKGSFLNGGGGAERFSAKVGGRQQGHLVVVVWLSSRTNKQRREQQQQQRKKGIHCR